MELLKTLFNFLAIVDMVGEERKVRLGTSTIALTLQAQNVERNCLNSPFHNPNPNKFPHMPLSLPSRKYPYLL